MPDELPPLREVINKYELRARRSLGQNFLLDSNLTGKIARSAGDLSDTTVIEVGPGPGGLTRSLLQHGARRVVAIERDERCVPALEELAEFYPGRLDIIHEDALSADFAALSSGTSKIVANLPYNIATLLLTRWLCVEPWPPWYSSMTLMFQREVGERLCAASGSRAYGRLSVLAQWRCDVEHLFNISPQAFTPAPKVTSSLLHFVPRPAPSPPCNLETLQRVTAAAFGQRRKMLRASLKTLLADPLPLLENAGIDARERAEQIDVGGFCRLANSYDDLNKLNPSGAH
jgi:16S rRNA (adenine1518-N6/adenine1519-N6)-dimethyltransferase